MITIQTVLNQLKGNEIYDSLIQLMTEQFEDFADTQNRYELAMEILQTELGEKAVTDAKVAIRQQTVSNLLFSGSLGLKANLDNFINPLTGSFLDMDSEVYLREKTARRLPEFALAQSTLDQFYALLSPGQKALHEDITAYICYLETVGPKLAHYYGYLLGNELLPSIIPGYHSDMTLTVRYRMILRQWLCV